MMADTSDDVPQADPSYFEALIEHALDLQIVLDEHLTIRYMSPSAERVLRAGSRVGQSGLDLLHSDDAARLLSLVTTALGQPDARASFQYRARHASGRPMTLEGVVVNRLHDPRVQGIVLSARDVSDRKALEDRALSDQRRLDTFFSTAPVGLAILDSEFRYVRVNETLARLNGRSVEAHEGHTVTEVLPRLADQILPRLRHVLDTGQPLFDVVINRRAIAPRDGLVHVRTSFFPIDRETGARDIAAVVVDLTEQWNTEEALAASEARYRELANTNATQRALLQAILDSAPVGIALLNPPDFSFEFVNSAFQRFAPGRTMLNRPCRDVWSEIIDTIGPALEATWRTGESTRVFDVSIDLIRQPDAAPQRVYFNATFVAIQLPGREDRSVLGLGVDTTHRKRLEEQFLHAQKMEAIGRLAGGIAHDFNNLLTAILGHAELAAGELTAGDPLAESIGEIQKAGESAARLTRQLLAFSRRQVLQPTLLDLNEVATSVHGMLKRVIGEDIALEMKVADRVEPVRADRGQLEQVLLNLAVNARDAMPRGGRLTIRIEPLTLRSATAALPPGRYACMAVADTGTGMTADTRAHLFEPFFSTKGLRGTGLGLATVYGIVRQSGGDITVETEEGHGTTFTICFPVADPAADAAGSGAAAIAGTRLRGAESVLVVEDDPRIRTLVVEVLRRLGYTAVETRTSEEALDKATTPHAGFDLIVSDVVMPGLTGTELARAVRAVRPQTRVLFISGYTEQEVLADALRQPRTAFLQKPFTPASLGAAVRSLLDS